MRYEKNNYKGYELGSLPKDSIKELEDFSRISATEGIVMLENKNEVLPLKKGDRVYKGQQIAKAGSTGRSTGVHCHFGIEYKGSFINPLNKLP